MSNEPAHGIPNWYVIHTNFKQENRGNINLRSLGVETLLPRSRERRVN